MKKYLVILLAALASASFVCAASDAPKPKAEKQTAAKVQKNQDWARYYFYEAANKQVKKAPVAVFMGDSITIGWSRMRKQFFADNNYVGRGIGGQTTLQMLARFHPDVVLLKPKMVLILAGCNDIAQNSGPIKLEYVAGNIFSMVEIAKANGIIPVICSVLPAYAFPWNKSIKAPAEKVKELNTMLKAYAEKNNVQYLDYYSKVVDERGGLPQNLARDGIHPTPEGYAIMEPLAKELIEKLK